MKDSDKCVIWLPHISCVALAETWTSLVLFPHPQQLLKLPLPIYYEDYTRVKCVKSLGWHIKSLQLSFSIGSKHYLQSRTGLSKEAQLPRFQPSPLVSQTILFGLPLSYSSWSRPNCTGSSNSSQQFCSQLFQSLLPYLLLLRCILPSFPFYGYLQLFMH